MKCYLNLLIVLALAAFTATAAFAAVPAAKPVDSPIVAKCKADLAKRLKDVRVEDITLVESKPTTWSDAALGMPEYGKMYAQVVTPGSRVILQVRNTNYLYVTSAKGFKYGGPVDIWAYSMLYTKPIKNEPNLNGDLFQCSLLGTNCAKLVSGVSEFYPQSSGAILFTRRTSRSGFDLLYIRAGQSAKPKLLHSAFAYGGAAFNSKQDKWAALVKPSVGAWWTVVITPTAGDRTKRQVLRVPDKVRPEQIAWSGDKIMILSKTGEMLACHETTPSNAKPEWKAVAAYLFPLLPDYMLNKSESLDISEVTADGKPGIEVARVWFTGNRNVLARIEGVTLTGQDLLPAGYAFVKGEKNAVPVVYIVDISTGELIPSATGIGGDAKPFLYGPRTTPFGAKKP